LTEDLFPPPKEENLYRGRGRGVRGRAPEGEVVHGFRQLYHVDYILHRRWPRGPPRGGEGMFQFSLSSDTQVVNS